MPRRVSSMHLPCFACGSTKIRRERYVFCGVFFCVPVKKTKKLCRYVKVRSVRNPLCSNFCQEKNFGGAGE